MVLKHMNKYMYIYMDMYCLGCAVLLLPCLFDLACFFLPSFSSLIKTCTCFLSLKHVHVFKLEMRRKKEASKVKQTNKAKQHSTLKAVTFLRKNELPRVGLEPTTLYTLDRALYQLSYRGSSAGWAQISHLIVHLMNRLTINSV